MAEKKPAPRRDRLLELEEAARSKWDAKAIYEANAPGEGDTRESFFVTFPYPYMNGRLHLGHAFSLTKAEFSARFQRLNGKNVLFPFGFHCTGMPIQAAANKVKKEIAEVLYLFRCVSSFANFGKIPFMFIFSILLTFIVFFDRNVPSFSES